MSPNRQRRNPWVVSALRDLDRRNGGNTSRMGGARVLIFKGDTFDLPWQAHLYIPERDCNVYGAGDTPKEAFANLIAVLNTPYGQLRPWPSSDEITNLLKLNPLDAKGSNPRLFR